MGFILVVIGHCNPPTVIRNTISSFHMPLFFFVSGLTYKKKSNSLINDVKRLILPYCLTVALAALSLCFIWLSGREGYYASLNELLRAAIFGSGSGHNGIKLIGEIWFLLALFWTKRVMDFTCSFEELFVQTSIVFSCVIVGVILASNNIWIYSDIDIALTSVSFMYAGWLIKKGNYAAIDNTALLVFMIMITIVARSTVVMGLGDRNYSNYWYIALPGAVAMSILVCKIAKIMSVFKISNAVSFIGRHSLLLLCIHSLDWRMPFPRFGQALINSFSKNSWYWALSALHRFIFDLLVAIIAIYFTKSCKRICIALREKKIRK